MAVLPPIESTSGVVPHITFAPVAAPFPHVQTAGVGRGRGVVRGGTSCSLEPHHRARLLWPGGVTSGSSGGPVSLIQGASRRRRRHYSYSSLQGQGRSGWGGQGARHNLRQTMRELETWTASGWSSTRRHLLFKDDGDGSTVCRSRLSRPNIYRFRCPCTSARLAPALPD